MARLMALMIVWVWTGCGGDGANTAVDGAASGADATLDPTADARRNDAAPPSDAPADSEGCAGTSLLAVPSHTAQRGPWPVGASTAQVGALTVEVWYPATFGSDAGQSAIRYDIREQLPPSEQATIPNADNPWQDCDCYRDLPIDTSHGPYPVVVFIHGTAGFRTQSLAQMTHWASRGFVVVAADHPGLKLADMLSFLCPDQASGDRDLAGNVDAILEALGTPTGQLAFLADRLDMQRIAVTGHSAGGGGAASVAARPGVKVVIPMAAGPTLPAGDAISLFMGAESDTVVSYDSVRSGYDASPSPKRFVGIGNTGHLAFSQLCELRNAQGKDLVTVAQDYNVCGAFLANSLFDCNEEYIAGSIATEIVNYATSAALESELHCSDAADNFANLLDNYPQVISLDESL